MNKVKVDNVEIAYVSLGSGAPVVLIHGHPFDHTMWEPQIEALATSYQVIAPDLRGYGESKLPAKGPSSFADYALDVLQLMDALKIESFHIAGLSLGGQIIMEVYRQAPDRVRSLIFADTFAGLDTPEAKAARDEAATKMETEGMNAYADESIHKMIRAAHVTTQPLVASHILKMMKGTNPLAAATAMRARGERADYLADVLPLIDIPTLIIVGRQDEFTPVEKAEEIHQNVQSSKLVIIEDAGHMPNLEQPAEFNKTMLDFLANISAYSEGTF